MLGTIKFIERSRGNYWFLSKRLKVADYQNKLQYNIVIQNKGREKKLAISEKEIISKPSIEFFCAQKGEAE